MIPVRAVEYDVNGPADVLVVREVNAARVPCAGEVRVRVVAASVNPKDTFVRKGRFRALTGDLFPRRTGYDFSGIVEACESQDPSLPVGTPVFGMLNGWAGGACATHVIAKIEEVSAAPTGVSLQLAAGLPLAGLTALQALSDIAVTGPSARVLVNGASGGVGLFAVQIAKLLGAEVTAVASGANEVLCRDAGADAFIDHEKTDALEQVVSERFDVVFDVFGNRSFAQAREALSSCGVYVSTVPNPQIFADIASTPDDRTVRARLVSVQSNRPDLQRLAAWAAAGKVRTWIDSIFDLDAVADAHRRVETKHTRGKVLVSVGL